MAEPELLVDLGVLVDGEWRCLGDREDCACPRSQLDLAGVALGVDVLRGSHPDLAVDAQHPFEPCLPSGLVCLGRFVRVDDHLEDAGVVAQVDEDETAMVAPAVDPAERSRSLPRVGGARRAAIGAVSAHEFLRECV